MGEHDEMGMLDDGAPDGLASPGTVHRRQVLRAAVATGAAAWTAPVVLDSMLSPAAAATPGECTFTTNLVAFIANSGGQTTYSTASFSTATDKRYLIFIAAADNSFGNARRVNSITGPISGTTAIGSTAAIGADQGSYAGSGSQYWYIWAYSAVGTGGTSAVQISFANSGGFGADMSNCIAWVVEVGSSTGLPGVQQAVRASGNSGSASVSLAALTSGSTVVLFGDTADPSDAGNTDPTWNTWTSSLVELGEAGVDNAGASISHHSSAVAGGPASSETVTVSLSEIHAWSAIAVELVCGTSGGTTTTVPPTLPPTTTSTTTTSTTTTTTSTTTTTTTPPSCSLSATRVASIESSSNLSSYATGSFTTAADRRYLILVAASDATSADRRIGSITGPVGSISPVAGTAAIGADQGPHYEVNFNGTQSWFVWAYTAVGTGATSTLTVNFASSFGSTAMNNCIAYVIEVSSTGGLPVVLQSDRSEDTSGTASVTLGALTAGSVVVFFGDVADPGSGSSPTWSGYTSALSELDQAAVDVNGDNHHNAAVAAGAASSATVSASLSENDEPWCAIAVELGCP